MQLRSWIILASLVSARVTFGYQFQTIATLTSDLLSRFGLSYTQLGTMIGTYMVLGAFVALPLGLLGRRFGEGTIMSGGLLLMTVGSCYSAWTGDPSGISAGRAAAGVGAVAMVVLQNKIIAEWFVGRSFMMAISLTVCAFPVGMGLAGIILPPLLERVGLRAALLTDAIPAGVALLLFVGSYRAPAHAVYVKRRFALPSARECTLLVAAGTAWMTYTAGFSAFASYLPASLSLRGYGLPIAGLVMAVATWGNVVGTLSGGGLANRFGGFNVFLVGTTCLVIGMVGLSVTPWPIPFAIILGVFGSIHPGVVMAVGTLSAKSENRAVGMGLFYTVYYVGGAIAPTICGIAADHAGRPEGGLWAATFLSLLAIPTFMVHRALSVRDRHLISA